MLKKYVLCIFLFFILLMSTYYISNLSKYNILDVKKDVAKVNSKSSCNIKEVKNIENTYEIKGYIPDTSYEIVNKKVDEIIKRYTNDFIENIKGLEVPTDERKFELTFSFDVYDIDNYITYVINIFADFGGAHPNSYIDTVTYNIKQNKIVEMKDLVAINKDILNIISKYTYENLKENTDVKEHSDEEMLISGTKPVIDNFKRFAFSKDGLIIFFEKYSVAPYVAGEFKAVIPYDVLSIKL